MFGLMRNFHRWASGRLRREITIIVIGLDNAGKSTLLATIAGDANAIIVPTIGQSRPITIKRDRSTVKFFDMGGGRTFRDVWSQYYESVHGIIFVVDSSDSVRMQESGAELLKAAERQTISGKPILIMANKQDLPSAASEADIMMTLGLDKLSSVTGCRYLIKPCVALPTASQVAGQPDSRVGEGLDWLLRAVASDFSALSGRVRRDEAEKDVRVRIEREAVRLRVEAAREERQRIKEAEERGEVVKPAAGGAAAADAGAATGGPKCERCKEKPAIKKSSAFGWRPVCQECAAIVEGRGSGSAADKAGVAGSGLGGGSSSGGAAVAPEAVLAPSANASAVPNRPATVMCVHCSVAAASRKSGALGWKPVCDACGEALDARRSAEAEVSEAAGPSRLALPIAASDNVVDSAAPQDPAAQRGASGWRGSAGAVADPSAFPDGGGSSSKDHAAGGREKKKKEPGRFALRAPKVGVEEVLDPQAASVSAAGPAAACTAPPGGGSVSTIASETNSSINAVVGSIGSGSEMLMVGGPGLNVMPPQSASERVPADAPQAAQASVITSALQPLPEPAPQRLDAAASAVAQAQPSASVQTFVSGGLPALSISRSATKLAPIGAKPLVPPVT